MDSDLLVPYSGDSLGKLAAFELWRKSSKWQVFTLIVLLDFFFLVVGKNSVNLRNLRGESDRSAWGFGYRRVTSFFDFKKISIFLDYR